MNEFLFFSASIASLVSKVGNVLGSISKLSAVPVRNLRKMLGAMGKLDTCHSVNGEGMAKLQGQQEFCLA